MTAETYSPTPDDDWLSGFLDGELDPAEASKARATIAGDPAIRGRLAQMRRTDAKIRSAGAQFVGDDVPPRFLATIDAGFETLAVSGTGTAEPLHDTKPQAGNDNAPVRWRIGVAMAASLAAGILVGTQLTRPADGTLIAPVLSAALDDLPSGRSITLASGERLTPNLTFASRSGGFCRRYLIQSNASDLAGLSCRRGRGGWSIAALIPQDRAPSAERGYVAAEGPDSGEIDRLIATLRAGDPLDSQAEAQWIDRDWR